MRIREQKYTFLCIAFNLIPLTGYAGVVDDEHIKAASDSLFNILDWSQTWPKHLMDSAGSQKILVHAT